MPNPLSNPKSSERDALDDIENHPGWRLIMMRMLHDRNEAVSILIRTLGIEEIARLQGEVATFDDLLKLRERMIEELESELRNFQEDDAHRKADTAFGY
jgi:hypothetical protein